MHEFCTTLAFVMKTGDNPRVFDACSNVQALGMSPSLLAAGMAADNLAMAVYFGVIMSIPASGQEPTTEIATGIYIIPYSLLLEI